MKWILLVLAVWLLIKYIPRQQRAFKTDQNKRAERPLSETEIEQIRDNIVLLTKEIPIDEFFEIEDKIKVCNRMDVYDEYGYFVVYNHTRGRFFFDEDFPIMDALWSCFVTKTRGETLGMHSDYMNNDNITVKFIPLENSGYDNLEELGEAIQKQYSQKAKSYFTYKKRVNTSSKEYSSDVSSLDNKKPKSKAEQKQYEKDIQDLEYSKKMYERYKQDAEIYAQKAQAELESARKGSGVLTTVEEKKKLAKQYMDFADYDLKMAEEEKKRIEQLERQLGK